MSAAASVGIGAVRVYQWTLRPLLGANCRFWPSCSEYAIDALRLHGALRGTAMATKRVLRCNPWHAGGVDPVPGSPGQRDGCSAGQIDEQPTDQHQTGRQTEY